MPNASSGWPASSSAPRIWRAFSTSTRPSRATAMAARTGFRIVQLHADEEPFFARHATASAENVLRFYVTDTENPTAIISAIANARENARALRTLISTEMWVQLNVFYNRLKGLEATALAPGALNPLFTE